MTVPQQHPTPPAERGRSLLRIALWVAIGALIAAAIVCVVWVLVGPENGLIGRAFLTILLLAGFAGAAILDAQLAPRRPAWFVLTSMGVWVVTLILGAFLIWMPERYYGAGFSRFVAFLLIVLILQLALLHVRLYTRAHARYVTGFTRTIAIVTLVLVAALAVMLVFPLAFNEFVDFRDIYWRIVVAITILAAVGTALVPLINALFAPKKPRAEAPALLPWPMYADGRTPLPALPDGSPDFTAYYTGHPTYPPQGQPAAPQQPPAPPQPAAPQYPAAPAPAAQPAPAPYPEPPHPAPPVPPHPGAGYPPPPPPR
ncbi:hypothetical protein ACIQLJ_12825 [Microbacterium sp. NPDC091313]